MTDVAIADAVLLYDSGLNGGQARFAVRPLGHSDYDRYDYQVGACFSFWREMDTKSRKLQLLIDAWHAAAFYAVPVEIMKTELLRIPEYRDMLADDCLPREFQHERN